MKKFPIALLLFLVFFKSYGQSEEGKIKYEVTVLPVQKGSQVLYESLPGAHYTLIQIINFSGDPLPNTIVSVKSKSGAQQTKETDANGVLKLESTESVSTIEAGYIGYKKLKVSFESIEKEEYIITFKLAELGNPMPKIYDIYSVNRLTQKDLKSIEDCLKSKDNVECGEKLGVQILIQI